MALKLKFTRFLVICFVSGVAFQTAPGSELSDSMQLFFAGDYARSKQALTEMAKKGELDARIYYFRGLANSRLGDPAAAAEDFQRGAQLEVTHGASGVGQALQRVQGLERLELEKHRRMAKLRSRQRTQIVAPPAIPRENHQVRLASGHRQARPLIRLASEVPIRLGPLPDPFTDDPSESLAIASPGLNNAAAKQGERPVGTGVAATANSATVDTSTVNANDLTTSPDGSIVDVFAVDETDETPATDSQSRSSRGVFGAVFRALGKATIPSVPAGVIPGIGGTGSTPPVDPASFDEDPFGEETTPDEVEPFDGF